MSLPSARAMGVATLRTLSSKRRWGSKAPASVALTPTRRPSLSKTGAPE